MFFSLEMTYQIHFVDDTVAGEKKMKVADGNGNFVRLGYLNDVEAVGFGGQGMNLGRGVVVLFTGG